MYAFGIDEWQHEVEIESVSGAYIKQFKSRFTDVPWPWSSYNWAGSSCYDLWLLNDKGHLDMRVKDHYIFDLRKRNWKFACVPKCHM